MDDLVETNRRAKDQAKTELSSDIFNEEVNRYKRILKAENWMGCNPSKKSFFSKIFPWKITITRLSLLFCLLMVCGSVIGQEVTPVDREIAKELVGTWKEIHTQNCLEGESLVVYYPDMTFEEHVTYVARDNCTVLKNNKVLDIGESYSEATSGQWMVSYGYVHYKTVYGESSSIKVISINKNEAHYRWDNGETCDGYKIGQYVK